MTLLELRIGPEDYGHQYAARAVILGCGVAIGRTVHYRRLIESWRKGWFAMVFCEWRGYHSKWWQA